MLDIIDQTAPKSEPDYEFLDPASVQLSRDPSGKTRLTVRDDRSYWDVRVVRCFPESERDLFVAFLNRQDKAIGTLRDPAELAPETLAVLQAALEERYFTPVISRIHRMEREFGAVYCDVDTNHGRREFVMRGLRESIDDDGGGRLLFTDVDGNRYRIADWRLLDRQSRKPLERLL